MVKSTKPGPGNSRFKMWICINPGPAGTPGVTDNCFSFPVNDSKGADFQFNYIYRNVLEKRHKHNYHKAKFYDLESPESPLKVVLKGGIISNYPKDYEK